MTPPEIRVSILVVDEDATTRASEAAILAPLGHAITVARDAAEALAQPTDADVAVVVIGLGGGGLDPALDLLARLHEHPACGVTPAVLVAAAPLEGAALTRALDAGALDVLVGPVDPDLFRAKLNALVRVYRLNREHRALDALHATATAVVNRAVAQRNVARETIREKDRYIGMLSHDLRNPLAAITAGVQLLLRSPALSEADRTRAARILGSAERMHHMIRDLLDYARTSSGDFPHRPVETDFRRLCHETVEELRAMYPTRAIDIEVRGDPTGVWDPDRLKQALSNLVANALQHGGGGAVRVDVDGAESEVVLAVHNDGDPIPATVLPVLFEPFRRGEGTQRGLGLGLYIVREIVRRHGGAIEVRSSASDGTTFTSRWPRDARVAGATVLSP